MINIRPETPADIDAIYALTKAAFDPMPYSDGNEAECVDKLRADGDLHISLVAVEIDKIVGHIAFSPVTISETEGVWYGLGPVSAEPSRQKSGIGSALIKTGLQLLKERDVAGCVLIGNPDYYHRFGFVGDGRITYRDLETKYVQWISFNGSEPSGVVMYSPGLE